VLIYKASGVFNFAQGIMVVFAALTLVGLHELGDTGFRGADPRAWRDAGACGRGRARDAAPPRQPARDHSVHGDLWADLLPHRFGEFVFGGEPKVDDYGGTPSSGGAIDLQMLGGLVSLQKIDIAAPSLRP